MIIFSRENFCETSNSLFHGYEFAGMAQRRRDPEGARDGAGRRDRGLPGADWRDVGLSRRLQENTNVSNSQQQIR